jgi:hypothetical protein
MRENQTVFPHRPFGFAERAAPIPGIGVLNIYSWLRGASNSITG